MPARGSHRPERARLTHSVPQVIRSLRLGTPSGPPAGRAQGSGPRVGQTNRLGHATPARGRALPRVGSPGVGHPVPPAGTLVSGDDRISYVPGEPLLCSCPALRPRQDPRIRPCNASARPPICPPRRLPHSYFRGSITRLRHWLSTLRRPGRPDTTQDSLPVVGQTLPDGLDHPQGSIDLSGADKSPLASVP